MSLTAAFPRPNPLTQAFVGMQAAMTDPSDVYFGVLLHGDGPAPDVAELRTHVAGRLTELPALTHRLRPDAGGEPGWEPDPHFDIDAHVTVRPETPVRAAPAGTLLCDATDLDRPLWRMVLLPGDGGQWGLAYLVHHGLGDGVALRHTLDVLFGEPSAVHAGPAPLPPGRRRHALRTVPVLLDTLRTAPPVSALAAPRNAGRVLTHRDVALSDLRSIAAAAGGATIGQVHLAALAGAIRRWSAPDFTGPGAHGRDVPVSVPVDIRRPGEERLPDNYFALLPIILPTGADDPRRRLRATARRFSRAKLAGRRAGLRSAAELPPRYAGRLLQRVADRRVTAFCASTFRPFGALRILGRPVTGVVAIPWLPLGASCFAILATYGGRATFSVLADSAVEQSPDLVARWAEEVGAMRESFEDGGAGR